MNVCVHPIETLVPEPACRQDAIRDRMLKRAGNPRTARSIRAVSDRSGITKRHSVLPDFQRGVPPELFHDGAPGPSTADRNRCYIRHARELSVEVARRALAGFSPADVTHVITASCTGFYNPGSDYDIVVGLGLPATGLAPVVRLGEFLPALAIEGGGDMAWDIGNHGFNIVLSSIGLSMSVYDVLIVGAGPVGLLLANLLGQAGVRALVVERRSRPPEQARAIGIAPPSLATILASPAPEFQLYAAVRDRVAAAVFLHRSFARSDGKLSVRKGFRVEELRAFLEQAGQRGRVERLFPGRLLVVVQPN